MTSFRRSYAATLALVTGGESLMGGRLLGYFPDAALCDGAPAAASQEFFDDRNMPPWDSWIAWLEDASVGARDELRRLLAH